MVLSSVIDSSPATGMARELLPQEGIPADRFAALFRSHPAGVAVITADPGTGPAALTATSVISVSADPALVVFSLSAAASATPAVREADTVVVHLLGADDLDLARLCSTSGADRFADASLWSTLPTGEPFFHGVGSWMRARVISRMDVGTATVITAHVLDASDPDADARTARPLVYHHRAWHTLGEVSRL